MMDTPFDFAIVGAGPAGATLARLLAPKYSVALLDKRWDGGQKCCGGLLAPDAQKALATMGLGLPAEVLDGPQLFGVRVIDVDNGRSRHYQRFYVNMNRGRFEDYLRSLLPEKVNFFQCNFLGAQRGESGWQLDCGRATERFTLNARRLVGADGGGGRVRALLEPPEGDRVYAAYQRFYREKYADGVYTALFDSSISDFYHWVIPKENYSVLGVTVPLGSSAKSGMETVERTLAERGFPFRDLLHQEGAKLRRPHWRKGVFLGGEGAFLVGEAAGFISPSSAEGISYALRSALLLARVALDEREENWAAAYRRVTKGLRHNLVGKTCKLPVMYNPLLRRVAMGSGLLALEKKWE